MRADRSSSAAVGERPGGWADRFWLMARTLPPQGQGDSDLATGPGPGSGAYYPSPHPGATAHVGQQVAAERRVVSASGGHRRTATTVPRAARSVMVPAARGRLAVPSHPTRG